MQLKISKKKAKEGSFKKLNIRECNHRQPKYKQRTKSLELKRFHILINSR
jgi:hypothetical protein